MQILQNISVLYIWNIFHNIPCPQIFQISIFNIFLNSSRSIMDHKKNKDKKSEWANGVLHPTRCISETKTTKMKSPDNSGQYFPTSCPRMFDLLIIVMCVQNCDRCRLRCLCELLYSLFLCIHVCTTLYRVVHKSNAPSFWHNCIKYWTAIKISSLAHSVVNLQ